MNKSFTIGIDLILIVIASTLFSTLPHCTAKTTQSPRIHPRFIDDNFLSIVLWASLYQESSTVRCEKSGRVGTYGKVWRTVR